VGRQLYSVRRALEAESGIRQKEEAGSFQSVAALSIAARITGDTEVGKPCPDSSDVSNVLTGFDTHKLDLHR